MAAVGEWLDFSNDIDYLSALTEEPEMVEQALRDALDLEGMLCGAPYLEVEKP